MIDTDFYRSVTGTSYGTPTQNYWEAVRQPVYNHKNGVSYGPKPDKVQKLVARNSELIWEDM